MKTSLLMLALLLVWPVSSFDSATTSAQTAGQSFTLSSDAGTHVLTFFSDEIAEVSFFPEGRSAADYRDSEAVVMSPQAVAVRRLSDDGLHQFITSGLTVTFREDSGRFSFYYQGRPLLREQGGFQLEENEESFRVDFLISEYEALMGGGSRALGMNRRGHRLELYNRAHYGYETRSDLINFTLPVVMSSNRYLLHFDNPTTGWLDLDSQNDHTIGFEAFSGRKTYQVVAGETWADIMQNYTRLTGLQPLPPRWALGNFSSRFGYRNQQEVLDTIRLFREKEVPVDAVIIDLYWFGPEMFGYMGTLDWDRENWPDPAAMVQELEEMDVRTVLITEPFILSTSGRWDEAVSENVLVADSLGNPATWDFFFGNTSLVNITKPEAADWFWGIYRNLMETYGIHGWWGDLGEPEVHPDWVMHHIGRAREVHNIYGHRWGQMVHEGHLRDFPDMRPFNLMRAGYAGSQRFGMIPWTGDVSRNWGGLKPQPEIALQMGMQGLAYIHSDLGGFAWPNKDPELYVRWMQYGVFQPVYRPHAQDDVPSEPVFWDEDTINLSRTAIGLRYRLMPYIYTMAFENSTTGMPLMRPLFFEEPDNFQLFHIANSYLFGPDLLVAPVLREGAEFVTLHAPATANWYELHTGEKAEGGSSHQVATVEDRIPVFARGGSVIAMADLAQSMNTYSVGHLTLHYFHCGAAENGRTLIYHDDGLTRDAHNRGMYEKLHVHRTQEQGRVYLTFETERGAQAGELEGFSDLSLQLRNFSAAPAAITLDGAAVPFTFDATTRTVSVARFGLNGTTRTLEIRM
ncbi:TIM-barrel domain-containing protein [Cyclonatronum proteinivorum]|nr:TIM-barrel domain-containing protein [Cyclonatronum proteinivorum]